MKHPGPNARRADYQVVRLGKADFKAAKAFVEALHYTKGAANTAVAIHGLFKNNQLVGVAWWMLPSSPRAAKYVARLFDDEAAYQKVLSLSRLVVAETEPRNAESILLGGAIADLKRDPRWSYLVTFADEGQVDPRTGQSHVGTVYKATGWTPAGTSAPTDRWEDSSGRRVALKASVTRTVRQMVALGYSRVGKTRKLRFVMALHPKRRKNPHRDLQAEIDAEVAAGKYDDPLKGDLTWERFCEVEDRLVEMRPGMRGYEALAREYIALRAKLKAARPPREPRRNSRRFADEIGAKSWDVLVQIQQRKRQPDGTWGRWHVEPREWVSPSGTRWVDRTASHRVHVRLTKPPYTTDAAIEAGIQKLGLVAPDLGPGWETKLSGVASPVGGYVVEPYGDDDLRARAPRKGDLRNNPFRYPAPSNAPPPMAHEVVLARRRLLAGRRNPGPAAKRVRELVDANEHLAERLLAVADPQQVGQVVTSPDAVAKIVRPLVAGYDQEVLGVVALNRKHAVIGAAVLTKGNDGFTIVDPRQILRWALAQGRSGAFAIALVHNHPSGDPTPSPQDREVTERVAKAGAAVGVHLLDHVVMTDEGRFTSLAEIGAVPTFGRAPVW